MMPSIALVQAPKARRLPPFPVLLVPLWPLVWFCLGVARLLDRDRPEDAAKLRAAMNVFRELNGLSIDVESKHDTSISIRFI
jgi:hypothetical protein